MKVIGLGNALVDILLQNTEDEILEKLKLPKGSMQLIQAETIPTIELASATLKSHKVSGGSAANTIHGLAKLGTACAYIGKVGPDELGSFYKDDLQKANVDAKLLSSETETGRAFTFITEDAERTFATYLGAAVELIPDEIIADLFKGYDLLHIEGYLVQNTELIEKALRLAKENGLQVSLDLASYNVVEANLKLLNRVIPEYVDIVFANEEESKAYTGMEPEASLDKIAEQVKVAVVKIGKEGSMIKSGNGVVKIGIIPVIAVDTTGAGDQYAAGFLHGYSQGLILRKCGELGALMAGTVIENYGARIADEHWKNVRLTAEKIKS